MIRVYGMWAALLFLVMACMRPDDLGDQEKMSLSVTETFENIVKPDVDKASYRVVTLDNNIKALMISDPVCDKASAAVDVGVGYFSDPDYIPGLAHFLEHLLFMGTEKYPSENEYGKFLNEHGGSSNAFTAETHTTYYFDVNHKHLHPALDRFAQFFVAPLFNPSCTEREMLAVDSENKKNLLQDNWRGYQLEKSLGNPEHPYHHFGTGNLETLGAEPKAKGLDIRSVLIEFYEKNYSSNLMSVVILGRESLDQLQGWVQEMFARVPNSNAAAPSWPNSLPWKADNHGSLTRIKTIKDTKSIALNWLIPMDQSSSKPKPQKYYSHLIGDEGEGSLLALLKQKHWATSLYAGGGDDSPGYCIFEINIDLSDEGFENYDEVIRLTHDHIQMLKRDGPNERIFNEAQALNLLHFRFKERQDPSTYAYKLARNLHKYSPEKVIIGDSATEAFDPKAITEFGDILANGKPRVFLSSKDDPEHKNVWQVEKWYGTEYYVKRLEEDLGIVLGEGRPNEKLFLPAPNDFIPETFDVLIKPALTENFAVPQLVCDEPSLKLWHKVDDQFESPKASVNLLFRNQLCRASPKNMATLQLFTELVKEELNAVAYPADIAGLKYDLGLNNNGIELRLSGFYDKLNVLLDKVLQTMARPQAFTEKGLNLRRDTYERYLKNLDLDGPYWITTYFVNGLCQEKTWWKWELLEVLPQISLKDVVELSKEFFKACQVECLVHGSIADPKIFTDKVTAAIQNDKPAPMESLQSLRLPDGKSFIYLPKPAPNPNSGAEIYLQICHIAEVRLRSLAKLFVQAFNEPFFDILRTQEQLGYLVNSSLKERGNSIGLRFAIQSERDPLYLDARMESFLSALPDTITQMSDSDFHRIQAALVGKLRERKTRLGSESSAHWEQITRQAYEFDRLETDAREVEQLTKADLLEFVETFVVAGGSFKRKLAVHVWSEGIADGHLAKYTGSAATLIKDTDEFWRTSQLYPSTKAFLSL